MSLNYICDKCNKPTSAPHYATCGKGKPREDMLFDYLLHNFKFLSKSWLEEYYVNREYSFPMLNSEFGLKSKQVAFLLERFSIKKRSIKDAVTTKTYRNKVSKTNLARYGAENPLAKASNLYEKRNETVKCRYGVENVFQVQAVKDKITEVHIQKYGVKRKTNPELISKVRQNFSDEKWDEIYNKYKSTIDSWSNEKREAIRLANVIRGKEQWKGMTDERLNSMFLSGSMNKLESRVAETLTSLGIPYVFSKFVARRQFDFKISKNILLEINGDYWHASPTKYKADDLINFPGVKYLAKDIWERDKLKKEIAESYGYEVVYIWEHELHKLTDEQASELIIEKLQSLIEDLRHR